VCKRLKNYERMKLLMEKWIDWAIELPILRFANSRPDDRENLSLYRCV